MFPSESKIGKDCERFSNDADASLQTSAMPLGWRALFQPTVNEKKCGLQKKA